MLQDRQVDGDAQAEELSDRFWQDGLQKLDRPGLSRLQQRCSDHLRP
jgi:hypothetical protein